MSRRIELPSDPDALSDEDRQYLADRGRTVEQEQQHQQLIDRIEGVVEQDESQVPARLEYMRRTGLPVTGDPARGHVRPARTF